MTTKQLTSGELARRCGAPLHRVTHILTSRNVQPIALAGCLRIYNEAAVGLVRDELAAIDAKRHRQPVTT